MNESVWQEEGKARFQVGDAFYNPRSKYVRDLGILAATIYQQDYGSLRVLDALAGCGVRSLRYYQESNADYLYINEGNPQLNSLLQQNLNRAISLRHGFAYASKDYRITHLDAHRVFFSCYRERDYYDLVDVDCFGSAVPYLSTMLWATKIGGLMYLTSTDGRTVTGHPPEKTVQTYNAIARSHPAIQERFLHGTEVDQVIAQENIDGEVLWGLADHQGSVKMLLDNDGSVVNNITYDAFGGITIETNSNVNFRFGYTGREHDEETGLRYHRGRYVAGNVFISQDPIGFEAGDTKLYRYVANNPLNIDFGE